MATITKSGKITLATVKAFIRRNEGMLWIDCRSHFDGMTDCVQTIDGHGFEPVVPTRDHMQHTLGIAGAWFVGGSRDYFSPWEQGGFVGIRVYNCCGSFTLAIPC